MTHRNILPLYSVTGCQSLIDKLLINWKQEKYCQAGQRTNCNVVFGSLLELRKALVFVFVGRQFTFQQRQKLEFFAESNFIEPLVEDLLKCWLKLPHHYTNVSYLGHMFKEINEAFCFCNCLKINQKFLEITKL